MTAPFYILSTVYEESDLSISLPTLDIFFVAVTVIMMAMLVGVNFSSGFDFHFSSDLLNVYI